MKALIVYDSMQGNTERIAKAIAAGMAGGTKAVRVGTAEAKELNKIDLLVLGSPTLGGRPTNAMQEYVNGIAPSAVKKLNIATFDTRLTMKFAKIFGYAADRIATKLTGNGSTLKTKPEGFIVKGRNGPLAEGELDRATAWGKEIMKL